LPKHYIVTYCPLPYNGRGPAESCIRILDRPQSVDNQDILIIPRARSPVPGSLQIEQAMPRPIRFLPWRVIKRYSPEILRTALIRVLTDLSPSNTVVRFWPATPVNAVKERGFITIREMINCFRGTAKDILDEAYKRFNIADQHPIDVDSVIIEKSELALYDYIFASNPEVEISLSAAGIHPSRILPTSFGWTPSKYRFSESKRSNRPLTALFVGTVGVRKGIPFLLRAWTEGGFVGNLILAGAVEAEIASIIDRYRSQPNIKFVEFVSDLTELYNSADLFVFPTLEEGGPQVVYEAAGAGLPIITTPMGAGRIVKDGQNGLIVPAADTHALVGALSELVTNPGKRLSLGRRAALDALDYTYDKIGVQRRNQMLGLLNERNSNLARLHSAPTIRSGGGT
jgi:glycosyltransferase involved in cell wall biosynthesis